MDRNTRAAFVKATDLDKLEEKVCSCGAAGSGEGHTEWCDAEMWDRIPEHMYAPQALEWVKAQALQK
jgi:hypothetical protein